MKPVNELMAKVECLYGEVFFLMDCYRAHVFASKYKAFGLNVKFQNTNFLYRDCKNLLFSIYDHLDGSQDSTLVINYLNRIVFRCSKISFSFEGFKSILSKQPSDFPPEYYIISKECFGEDNHSGLFKRLYQKKFFVDDLILNILVLTKMMARFPKHITTSKDIFGADETANYLGISISTLYKLTSRNAIPYHKPSGKIMYFKKADLENWMLQNRINSVTENNFSSIDYVAKKKCRKSIS